MEDVTHAATTAIGLVGRRPAAARQAAAASLGAKPRAWSIKRQLRETDSPFAEIMEADLLPLSSSPLSSDFPLVCQPHLLWNSGGRPAMAASDAEL